MLTRETAESIVSKALGGDPDGRTTTQIADMAGQEMLNMRSWNWANETPATVDLVSEQEYAELPSDFLGFVTKPRLVRSGLYGFVAVSLQTIEDFRATTTASTGTPYYWALGRATTLDNEIIPRLELFPTPSSDSLGAIRFFYRRDWPGLGGDAQDRIRIPVFMENLYVEMLRAFARGWEDDLEHPHAVQGYLRTIVSGDIYRHAVETDQVAQPGYDEIRGGVADTIQSGFITFSGTGAPS